MTRATTIRRRRTPADPRGAAVLSGVSGVVADVLLVLFFALTEPFSAHPTGPVWLGTANDWFVLVQFAALVPVAAALGRRLPATPGVRFATAAGIVAMAATVALQLLLVAGLLPFHVQVWPLIAALVVVFLWILSTGVIGHRTAALPRSLSRLALLLGASLPTGLLMTAAGLIAAEPARWVLLVPGLAIGAAGWLALPVFPLSIARRLRWEDAG